MIDPAVAYGCREMYLACSELFGGFAPAFYTSYQASFPLPSGYEQRKGLLHLYYLLVHANLFGAPYPEKVATILARFDL